MHREPPADAARRRSSSSAKMTLSALRFAYTSAISRAVVASARLDDREDRRDAAAAREGDDRGLGRAQHEQPRRGHHLDRVARASASFIQFDIFPPGTRFTVTVKRSPVSGELDIE